MESNGYEGTDVGYDDYESDFDSSFDADDGGVPDTAEGELDAIASLISGDSSKADALAAQREKTGETSKTSRAAIDVDSHGRRDYGGSDPAPQQQPERKHETIYGHQVEQAKSHAQSEWQAAHAENDRLQRMYEEGQIDAQT